jgi:hypothetical protein
MLFHSVKYEKGYESCLLEKNNEFSEIPIAWTTFARML